ncbi:MAG: hypothetical protein HQM10_04255 [Candidatus Riflebacteria bacterium]|nr:hypothetical protein [Candidatus Riflebacteria bacterium]
MNKFLLLLWVFAFASLPANSSQNIYNSPDPLKLHLSQTGEPDKDGIIRLNGKIEGNLGEIRDISVTVFGSSGITVEPASTTIAQLSKGKSFDFEIKVKDVDKQVGKPIPWVKFRVKYVPDFKALLEHIQMNEKDYSDEFARNELIQNIKNGLEKSEHRSQVVGHRFLRSDMKQK